MSNLAITGVEVSQAVQYYQSLFPLCGTPAARTPCSDNSIPPVAGKATVVRAYLSGTPAGAFVSGIASYTDSNSNQKFLSPIGTGAIPAGLPSRVVASDALTFLIPSQDAYPGVASLSISAFIRTIGRPGRGASATVNLAFAQRGDLLIRLVRVHYQSATLDVPAPTLHFFWSLVPYMRGIYPVSATRILLIGDSEERCDAAGPQFFNNLAPGSAGAGTTGTLFHILDQLAAAEGLSQNVVYLALYPLDLYVQLLSPGFSGVGGGHRTVICGDPNATPNFAHEVGHALGLWHAPAGGAGGPDPNYPSYAPLPSGSIGETGFDGSTGDPKDPATSFDFMSYAGPPWISPYHYLKLYDTIGPGAWGPRFPRPGSGVPPRDVAFFTVQRILDRNTIVVLPGWVVPGPVPPISEIGEFRAQLVDREGRVLAQTNFDIPSRPKSTPTDEISWWPVALPWYEDTDRLQVSRNGKPVVDRRIDPKRPRLAGRYPAGDFLGGTAVVRWTCSPPAARVMLRYSADGGATWVGIIPPRKGRSAEVDLDRLPGGEHCCFELLASADLRTTIVRSPFFRVAPKTPRPLLISPGGTRSVGGGVPVEFSGAVTDQGDPDGLVWTSSLDGELGRGSYLVIADLTVGQHRIGLHLGAPDERSVYTRLRVTGGEGR